MAEPDPRSPLSSLVDVLSAVDSQSEGALAIRELPFTTQIALRIDPGSVAGLAVADLIGGPLPTVPNTAENYGTFDVLWLGPDEWLLVNTELTAHELENSLRKVCNAEFAAIVDVSAQRTLLELTGSAVRTVLAKGCTLDLHAERFAAGSCAQTLAAQAPVILQPIADPHGIRVFVRASFAQYLAAWLLDASSEERLSAEDVRDADKAIPTL